MRTLGCVAECRRHLQHERAQSMEDRHVTHCRLVGGGVTRFAKPQQMHLLRVARTLCGQCREGTSQPSRRIQPCCHRQGIWLRRYRRHTSCTHRTLGIGYLCSPSTKTSLENCRRHLKRAHTTNERVLRSPALPKRPESFLRTADELIHGQNKMATV
jgi:hypothetical protein